MAKSKKSKPEPKSPSPATSPRKTTESSDDPQSPTEHRTPKSSSSPPPPPEEDFESYYMKRVTAEFADDIDKLRNAADFSERSAPVLIRALKQGSKGFSGEEREQVMKGR